MRLHFSALLVISSPCNVLARSMLNRAATTPSVQVLNGTYHGVHNVDYKQDFFLGIPYAQAPIQDLRFKPPQSLNLSWNGSRNATDYSDIVCLVSGRMLYSPDQL